MKNLITLLQQNKQYKEIFSHLSAGKDCFINGLWGSSANFVIAAIANERPKGVKKHPKILLVVANIEEAQDDFEDLNTFLQDHASLFPASEAVFIEDEDDSVAQKVLILKQIFYHDTNPQNKLDIIVAPIQALLQPVPPPQTISENSLCIQKNQEYPREECIAWLQDHGYQLTSQVENAGEYATRGGIVDVFPYASDAPYRIEYFGDEIESIRKFDIESQLST